MSRTRHYVITLQRMYGDGQMRYYTQSGDFLGDANEGDAFDQLWVGACRAATGKLGSLTGLPDVWSMENTAVLFYRLVER